MLIEWGPGSILLLAISYLASCKTGDALHTLQAFREPQVQAFQEGSQRVYSDLPSVGGGALFACHPARALRRTSPVLEARNCPLFLAGGYADSSGKEEIN